MNIPTRQPVACSQDSTVKDGNPEAGSLRKEAHLLDVVAFSAQIPWQRVKAELSERCARMTVPFGVVVSQLTEEIRAGKWVA
jgi:hypothetical protein